MTRAQKKGITDFPYYEFEPRGDGRICMANYFENSKGYWEMSFYEGDNIIYEENSKGWWKKRIYEENEVVHYEDADGKYWTKNMNIPFPYVKLSY